MARRKRCLRAAYGEDVQYSISHPSSAVEYKHVWDKMQIPESISPARLRVQISVHTVSALSHCHATLFRPDPRTTCSSCRLRGKRGRLLGTFGRPRYAWPAGFEPSPTSLEPSATGLESSATGDRQCHGLYLLQRPGSTPLVQYFAVLCR